MESTYSQQLNVVEIFRVADGKTVFVGPFDGEAKYIAPCEAELVVDGKSIVFLHLEGEMMAGRRHPMGYRSVSTRNEVDVNCLSPSSSDIRIRIVPSS